MRLLFTPLVSIAIVAYSAMFGYDRIFGNNADTITSRGVLVYTVSIIILFHLIYRGVNFMLVRFFPLRKYEDLLYEFAKKLGRCSELRDIYKESVDILRQEDSPGTSSAVLLWKSSPGQPFMVRSFFSRENMDTLKLDQDSPLVDLINDEFIKRMDAFKRLPVLIRAELNKICSDEVINRINPELERFGAQICLPLIYREGLNRKLMGFLFLGEPLSSDVYTGADYDFFREVAEQTMLTLMNGEARERIGKMEKLAYLGNMAMGWGHQLNNILFRISLRGRMITEILGCGIDREHLTGEEREKVHTAINDADNLIKAALQGGEVAKDFLRLTKTLKRRDIEQVDLYERITAAIHALEDRGRIEGVCVRNRISRDFKRIEGIGYCFEEVFKNLIDNAARAVREQHPEGGGWIDLDADMSEEKSHVVVTVKDNGCGMSTEDVANLGTPLFSVIGKETDGGRHGLGVSVIYYYVMNIHNGDIKVESSPGKGTVFFITLPIRQDVSPDTSSSDTVPDREGLGRIDSIDV
jgi:signal transduction histidine kinase